MTNSRRLPLIGIGTLIVLAAAAAMLLWVVAGPGNAGADEFKQNANGDFAQTGFGFAGGGPGADVAVSRSGNGKNKITVINYDANDAVSFGFGEIPNGDYKGSGNNHRVDTNTSRITGAGIVMGASGPIKASFVGDGNVTTKNTGKTTFGFAGHEQTLKGQQSNEDANVSGSVVGTPTRNRGVIGKLRGVLELKHVP